MTRPHLAPRPIRLDLQPLERHLAHHLHILLRLQAAPVDPDVHAQRHQPPHLLDRPREAVHQPPPRQPVQPRAQQPLKVVGRGARVQEEGQLQLHGQVQLRLEEAELRLLGAQEEAVVVEADLAERDRVARRGRVFGERAQRREEAFGAAVRVRFELVGRAGVDADGGVAETGWLGGKKERKGLGWGSEMVKMK